MTEEELKKANFLDGEMQKRFYANGEKFTVEDVEYVYDVAFAEGRKERNCVNCSNHGKRFEVIKLEKEKCELLGIIQSKDNEIAKFKTQITELEKRINSLKIKNASLQRKNVQQAKQIEQMKCCKNCNNWKYNAVGDRYCTKNAYCNGITRVLWELKEQGERK